MSRITLIELQSDTLKFSAGHFMMHSNQARETLHGHDYEVLVALRAEIIQNGMSFDARDYKKWVSEICQGLDYRFILPGQSEYLKLEETNTQWIARLKDEEFLFHKKDAIVLPICNTTLEELSHWFVLQLAADLKRLERDHIIGMSVKIKNGRGEMANSTWGNL